MRAIKYCDKHDAEKEYLEKHTQYLCRECSKEKSIDYRKNRRSETTKRVAGAWYRSRILGIPSKEVPEEIDNQLIRQGGGCAICNSELNYWSARLDHNHTTGIARGLLCHKCNVAIGLLGDDPNMVKLALDYLVNAKWG